MALGSFSLSLLMQVHEAAAVVESGGDAGEQRTPLPYRSSSASGVRGTESRVARGGDGLLLVEVHLQFANVDARPIFVRRAS